MNLPISNPEYIYYPVPDRLPGGFTNVPFDDYSIELCGDGIDNDGDLLIDEDCDRKLCCEANMVCEFSPVT